MADNEKTSPEVADLAAKGLRYPESLTNDQIQSVCASALTQVADKNTKDRVPEFGDLVTIEMKSYGCDNEFYQHKVIGTSLSNNYATVPVDSASTGTKNQIYPGCVAVINCIQSGVDESEVVRFKLSDVTDVLYSGSDKWQKYNHN